MSKAGDKRPAGGSEDEIQFSDEQIQTLENSAKDLERLEYALERDRQIKLDTAFQKRREILKTIPGFWPTALRNHVVLNGFSIQAEDQKALTFLEDVWVTRDPKEYRAFAIEFHFGTNPFFSDAVLKKEYKYVPPTDAEALKEDENGVSAANLDFEQVRDTEPSTTSINWKDATKALTKVHPRIYDPEDKDEVQDHGSFFNLFEHPDKDGEIASLVAFDLFPAAIDYFFGRGESSHDLDDDEDDEEDGSDEEDIDLENPKKKAKN